MALQPPTFLTEEKSMFKRLLVAIDHSPSTSVTLSFATALARSEGSASVHVLHVNRFLVGGRGVTELSNDEATQLVSQAVLQLLEEGVDTTGAVLRSSCFSIGQTIAGAAHANGSEVIVLGSHRRTVVPLLFGQGIRERITRSSALPILTAPAPLRVPGRRRYRRAVSHPDHLRQPSPIPN
jgi:nucleotide-binding universal stress UspA family protein